MARLVPRDVRDLAEVIAAARADGTKLAIMGGGSLNAHGRPQPSATLVMSAFTGIHDYDPAELVITAGAGTPLAVLEQALAEQGQMLGFDPWDHGRFFGGGGRATIGGIVGAGTAGPRRLAGGGARDHVLGFSAVTGRGELFKGGGKVVKNVTGFDLSKVMTGSWGRLAAMTEVTLRVLPRPEKAATLVIERLSVEAANAMMATSLGSNIGVSAAAFLPECVNDGISLTLLEIVGFEPSVRSRTAALTTRFGSFGSWHVLDEQAAQSRWHEVRSANFLTGPSLWRVHLPPSSAPRFVSMFTEREARWLSDWAGGLIWLELAGHHQEVRAAADAASGRAVLVRAPDEVRALVPAHHPQPAALSALERRVRLAFDPDEVWNTGRFFENRDAN